MDRTKQQEENLVKADKEIRTVLDAILAKPLTELTPGDKEFLRARQSYLNPQQGNLYKDVINEKPDKKEDKVNEEEVNNDHPANQTDDDQDEE